MVQLDSKGIAGIARSHEGPRLILVPCPSVSKPDRGKQIQMRRFRPTIRNTHTNENVLAICFRVLDKNVEISVLVKDPGIKQFEFSLMLSAAAIFFNQSRIRIFLLRVLVEILHV